MNMNEVYPSKYIKAADLQGREITVTIDRVEMEVLGEGANQQNKPVIYFQGKDRGLVCNKTNSNSIVAAYGFESNDWRGKQIVLFSEWVEFRGKSDWAIRVRPPGAPIASTNTFPPDRDQEQTAEPVSIDDEIPF